MHSGYICNAYTRPAPNSGLKGVALAAPEAGRLEVARL